MMTDQHTFGVITCLVLTMGVILTVLLLSIFGDHDDHV